MKCDNISQLLRYASLHYPDKIAVHLLFSQQPTIHLSYRELFKKSAILARMLEAAEVQPGEVTIIILQHSQELLLSFFGVMLQGAIPSIMPFMTEKISPDKYRSSLKALFTITQPAAVITYQDFLPEAKKACIGTSVRKIFTVEEIFLMHNFPGDLSPEFIDFNALGGISRQPEDIALLQHSSGTTGLQKGVALSHQAIFNQLESYKKAINFTELDSIASWLPLYHDMGLIAGFLMPILLGANLVLLSPFDWVRAPYRLFQAITEYHSAYCWLPNFAYNFCAQKIRDHDLEGVDLSHMKALINCSEPMYWDSHKLFFTRFSKYGLQPSALATSYAMAENVFAVTQGGIHNPVNIDKIDRRLLVEQQIAKTSSGFMEQDKALCMSGHEDNTDIVYMMSAGQPIEGTQVTILDNDKKVLGERVIGEIAIKSNCMLTGYFNRPDLTEEAFFNGWYLTGDLGYKVKDQIFITGRKKDLIIVGGKNIYPQDLEQLANEIDGVYPGRVVAFGIYDKNGGTEEVVMVAETRLDDKVFNQTLPNAQLIEISQKIRQRVTQNSDVSLRHVHLVPRNWLIKTSSGKIARSANREKYLAKTR